MSKGRVPGATCRAQEVGEEIQKNKDSSGGLKYLICGKGGSTFLSLDKYLLNIYYMPGTM